MSVKKTILILSIILYSSNQAYSLNCYGCRSKIGEDCYNNPSDYKGHCRNSRSIQAAYKSSNNSDTMLLLPALTNSSTVEGNAVSYARGSVICVKLTGTAISDGQKVVVRGCDLESTSDGDLKLAGLILYQYNIDAVYRCNTDYCNSSSALSIGFLSFISSLFLLLFVKL